MILKIRVGDRGVLGFCTEFKYRIYVSSCNGGCLRKLSIYTQSTLYLFYQLNTVIIRFDTIRFDIGFAL